MDRINPLNTHKPAIFVTFYTEINGFSKSWTNVHKFGNHEQNVQSVFTQTCLNSSFAFTIFIIFESNFSPCTVFIFLQDEIFETVISHVLTYSNSWLDFSMPKRFLKTNKLKQRSTFVLGFALFVSYWHHFLAQFLYFLFYWLLHCSSTRKIVSYFLVCFDYFLYVFFSYLFCFCFWLWTKLRFSTKYFVCRVFCSYRVSLLNSPQNLRFSRLPRF